MKKQKSFKTSLCLFLCIFLIGSIGSISAAASSPVSIATENEWEVLKIVNQERIHVDKQALSITPNMQNACDTRASELLSYYSHYRPNGSLCFTVLDEMSITCSIAGENIAAGYQTPAAVMDGWMNSEGHRQNILSTTYDFQHIGIGHDYSDSTTYGDYWVQLFIGSTSNSFSNLTLYGGQSTNIALSVGQTLSDLNLALQCTSSVYGTCYLPLIDEMCSGFSATASGTQTVTVKYQGLTLDLKVTVTKTDQATPTGLQGVSPSSAVASDGSITGVTTAMEYRKSDASAYTACTGTNIQNLPVGTYYVRYKETETHNASPDVAVVISFTKTDQAAPTGLQGASPSSAVASDGSITGVTTAMEYRKSDESVYITCAGTNIQNLPVGTYYVRYKETETHNASPDVAVVVSYQEPIDNPFDDVSSSDWFYNAVGFVADYGIFAGVGNNKFDPEANMTRAMFVQTMYNLAGKMGMPSVDESYTHTFTDVKSGEWYEKAVAWASGIDLVSGYSEASFGPDDNITREQMAMMLVKFADYAEITLDTDGNSSFTDGSAVSGWAAEAVRRAAEAGFVSGYTDGSFGPLNLATRAEVAAVFKNLVERYL